jgi:hypothetical protein
MKEASTWNQEKIVKILFFILSMMLLAAMIAGCSPQKKLARLERNHPELVKTKIEYRDTSFVIKGKTISDQIKENVDTSGVDKITDKYKGKIDTIYLKEINKEVKTYIVKENQNLFHDTSFVHGKDTILIKHTPAGFSISVIEGDTTIKVREKIAETTVSPDTPWNIKVHKFWRKFRIDFLILVAIIGIIAWSYRQFRK